MASRREPLPALTSLRFFAALAIFVVHAWSGLQAVTANGPAVVAGAIHLNAGVNFFFVLSGFILTYNYLDELRRPSARGAWNFCAARWARIYPVHALACLPMLLLTWKDFIRGGFGEPVGFSAAYFTLTHAFLGGHLPASPALNPPAWSLSAEWFFYLCLPLLIPGLTTGGVARRAGVLLLCLAPWALALLGLLGYSTLWAGTGRDPHFFPPVRLVDFLAGVLLGICWRPGAGAARAGRWWATAVEAGAVLFFVGWFWGCMWYATTPARVATCLWGGLYIPAFVPLIWAMARGGGLLSRLLATRPLVWLGEISYSFYMFHHSVLIYSVHRGRRIGFNDWAWQWKWLATALVAVAVSAACYHLYELPLRDRLRRWLSIRRPAPVEVPADTAPGTIPLPIPEASRRAA
jgi:peptidoglycan/LPS O-acetylase OafA/YrhL